MRRRDFLSLFLLAPASTFAEDGLLIDVIAAPVTSGLLCDAPQEAVSGMLLDIPPEVVEGQKQVKVHIYSPKTWNCPHCNAAEKALKDHPGVEVVSHKDDTLRGFFSGKSFPILHWGPGDAWQQGWSGKEQFLAKLFKDDSQSPAKKPVQQLQVKDSHGSHWSVEGDWSPSRQKTINHLVNVHGYQQSRVEDLNLGQLLTLHDYAHEGHKAQTQQVRSNSCPTGSCPTQSRSQSNGQFLWWSW